MSSLDRAPSPSAKKEEIPGSAQIGEGALILGATEGREADPTKTKRRGQRKSIFGGTLVVLVVLFVLCSFLPGTDPNVQDLPARLLPPVLFGGNWEHPLGTDPLGRDMLSRLMAGGRIDLAIGIVALLLSTILGVTLGLLAAFYGRAVDVVLNGLTALQLALPTVLIVIVFLAIIGQNIITIALILALSDWVFYARTVRAKALAEMPREYVAAGRVLGMSNKRIIFRHILPNCVPTIMVLAAVTLGQLILLQASLSYLGLGVQRPFASWGLMVSDGQAYMSTGWWISTLPALIIAVIVIGVNLLGDGLREVWKME